MFAILAHPAPTVKPTPADHTLADRFAWLHDGVDLEAYPGPGWGGPSPSDEAEWLGYQLGLDGVDADLLTPNAEELAAFRRGLDAGDDHLWRVDPLFASFVKERADAAPR